MARRARTWRARAAVPARVVMLALGVVIAVAGCAGSNGSPAPPLSIKAPGLVFHEPRTPKGAAYEYVQAMAQDRTDLTGHLAGGFACGDRLDFGSWPLTFTWAGTERQMHVV